MTDEVLTSRLDARGHWLPAICLFAAGVGGTFLAVRFLLHTPAAPLQPQAILKPHPEAPDVLVFSLMLCWSAAAPAALGAWAARKPRWLAAALVGLVGAAVVSWALLAACASLRALPAELGMPLAARAGPARLDGGFLLACGQVFLAMLLAGGVVGAFLGRDVARRGRRALILLLVCSPLLVLVGLADRAWWAHANWDALTAAASWVRRAAAIGLVLLVTANAATIAYACVRTQPRVLAVALLATAALAAPGWLLAEAVFPPGVSAWPGAEAPGAAMTAAGPLVPAMQRLLGGSLAGQLSATSLALRWCMVQWAAVLLVAWGHVVALVMSGAGPARRAKPAPRDAASPDAPERQASPGRPGRIYLLLTLAYAAFFFYGSLVPLTFRYIPLDVAWRRFTHLTWVSISSSHRSDLVANLLLSIPLLFLAMAAATNGGRRRGGPVLAILLPPLGTLLACAMEFAQLYVPQRTSSLNDIVAQASGSVLGVLAWLLFGGRATRWAQSLWRQRVRHDTAVKILAGYVVGLAIYQLWPFDLSISPAEAWHKYKAGRITLRPFADLRDMWPYVLFAKIGLLVPVGYLAWAGGRSNRLWRALGVGVLLAAGIELGQVLVAGRFASVTDVFLGVGGALLGAWLAQHLSPAAERPWTRTDVWRQYARTGTLLLLLLALGLLAVDFWSPEKGARPGPVFRWPPRGLITEAVGSLRVPFYHLHQKSVFDAANQAARRFGWFFLMGVIVRGLTGPSRTARRWALVLAWAIALILEAGQLFTPSRVPDLITTVLILGAGGTLGALLEPWLRAAMLAPRERQDADGPPV